MFKKILIANRGEIALRVIRTCREMGIQTVAVYSTADAESLHVRFADEAVCIGKPQSSDSYLNIPRIMAAAEITNADAIHPGYGFLAENAEFADICARYNIKFIGPTSEMMRLMGDKITAKDTMIKAGVPVIPGSEGLLQSVDEAKLLAAEMGYPVLLKATAGGGGKGMRLVWKADEIEKAYEAAKSKGQYKGQYAINTVAEYWAEGTQWWFWSNYEFYDGNTRIQSPDDLKSYDPVLFNILDRVYAGHRIPADVYHAKNVRPARRSS